MYWVSTPPIHLATWPLKLMSQANCTNQLAWAKALQSVAAQVVDWQQCKWTTIFSTLIFFLLFFFFLLCPQCFSWDGCLNQKTYFVCNDKNLGFDSFPGPVVLFGFCYLRMYWLMLPTDPSLKYFCNSKHFTINGRFLAYLNKIELIVSYSCWHWLAKAHFRKFSHFLLLAMFSCLQLFACQAGWLLFTD